MTIKNIFELVLEIYSVYVILQYLKEIISGLSYMQLTKWASV